MRNIYVLIACEESQAETIAFRNQGAVAFSCDLQPCKPGTPAAWHIVGDATPFLQGKTNFICQDGSHHRVPAWDIIIAHPPCTFLCKLSSVHLRADAHYTVEYNGTTTLVNEQRYKNMISARYFFFSCLNSKAKYVAVENPLPMSLAELPRPSFFIQPSWYGHKYTKKTLYWTKNLPPLMPTVTYPKPKCYVNASKGKYRARTFKGVAEAMAQQWLDVVRADLGILPG